MDEREINASSVGLCLAALETCSGLKFNPVFPAIHVIPDDIANCRLTVSSLFPRESSSKELDSATLFPLCYPGFIKIEKNLKQKTINAIIDRRNGKPLIGKYGFKRFFRDGWKCPLEDPSRLYFDVYETKSFENLESQWPIFYVILYIEQLFEQSNMDKNSISNKSLENINFEEILSSLVDEDGLLPTLYAVTPENVDQEIGHPDSSERVPHYPDTLLNQTASKTHYMGQALYYITRLLVGEHISCHDLDPLNRHTQQLQTTNTINSTVVEIVMFSESDDIAEKFGIQTRDQLSSRLNLKILTSKDLTRYFCNSIGVSETLDLSGRPKRRIGGLSTSKIYKIANEQTEQLFGFVHRLFDDSDFYFVHDLEITLDIIVHELCYIAKCWTDCNFLGRPLFFFPVSEKLAQSNLFLPFLQKIRSGYVNGARVFEAGMSNFIETTLITEIETDESQSRSNSIPEEESLDMVEHLKIMEKYNKACDQTEKNWYEIRRYAAKLKLQPIGIMSSLVHLLLSQKQITIGLENEYSFESKPPQHHKAFLEKIEKHCNDWHPVFTVITQEIIIYLAQFLRQKPDVFKDFLRLRISLIIKVLYQELARKLNQKEDPLLLAMVAPYSLQQLVYHILTSQDFNVNPLNDVESNLVTRPIHRA